MSEQYRLMIYFAVATFHLYSKDIELYEGMTVDEFRDKNSHTIQRVFDEALSVFDYELSYEQMDRAISAYASGKLNPQSAKETEVYAT